MKNSSKRTISRILAFVMLVSCMFTNIMTAGATDGIVVDDDVISSAGAVVDLAEGEASLDDLLNCSVSWDIAAYDAGADMGNGMAAVSAFSLTTDGASTFTDADGNSYVYSKASDENNCIGAVSNGDAISYTAPSDGKFTIAFKVSNGKTGTIFGETITASDGSVYAVRTYDVTADTTYTAGVTGSKIRIFYMGFEPATDEDTTTGTTIELGTPEAGTTYSVNFAGLTVNDKLNGYISDDSMIAVVSDNDTAYVHDSSHGAALYDGDYIMAAVAGDATIVLSLCVYGNGTGYTVTDADGNEVKTVAGTGSTDGETVEISYTGDATVLKITLAATGEAYLHSVTVKNAAEPIGEAENFEFWLDDIAYDVTGDDGSVTKTVEPGEYAFADSTVTLIGNGDEKFTPSISAAQNIERAGKTVNAYKAGARNANANYIGAIPAAGDGTAVVFTPAATGTFVTYLYTTSFLRVWDFYNDGTPVNPTVVSGYTIGDYYDSDTGAESYAFKAEAGHTYVLSTTGKTNNCAFAGFEYIVDEPVTVGVSFNNVDANADSIASLEVYLTDVDLNTVDATITADTTSVSLANGHTYALSTNDGGVAAAVNGSDSVKITGENIVIDLTDVPDVTLSGEITGTDEGTVTALTFTNMINGTAYEAVISGLTYSVSIKPGDYNTSVETTNGGVTYDRASVTSDGENVNEVYVEVPDASAAATYNPDDIAALETTGTVSSRGSDFTAKADATVTVPVGGTQVVTVNSYYQADFTISGANGTVAGLSDSNSTSQIDSAVYTTDGNETSITITFGSTYGTSYLTSITVVPVVNFVSEINVPGDYDTLTEAIAAINGMQDRPEGEEGRVTINLTADIQEQVLVDADYVKINGNNHTIQWYYGVGTFYYSIDDSGYYSERLYRDKYSSNEGNSSLWGGVVIVKGDYFLAEDTIFKNTYNYEVTGEAEVADVASTTGTIPMRSVGTDVQTYAAKERANALYVDGDHLECYNCQILSGQDTLGANKDTDYYAYFKDCVIGGNTDFICGAGNMVFDNCTLQWKSLTQDTSGNNAKLIGPTPREGQYVFRNCTWTSDSTENGTVLGKFGRTWQQNSKSAFINTETNGLIDTTGWGEMSSGQFSTSEFLEYNNYVNGAAMDVTTYGNLKDKAAYSGAYTGDALAAAKYTDEELAELINPLMDDEYTIATLLGGWTPVHYEIDDEILWGDVDSDGEVTVLDVSLTLDYVLASGSIEDAFDDTVADVSGDGVIDSQDVALILQKVLDSTFLFPVEEEDYEASTETTTDAATETTTEGTTPDLDAVTVYIVGDSTACHYDETADTYYWYKRVGFGDKLADYLSENATVVNLALSGRSSKSFATGINENGITDAEAVANYAQLTSEISEGDYLIIAWGHNDEKTDQYRYTDPTGDINTEGSFKNSLYTNYIKVAQDKGATPILCTPIIRANASGTLSDNDLHKPSAGDYGECIRELATELDITLIDNLASTQALYTELGAGTAPTSTDEPTGYLALHAALQDLSVDTTHLNAYGASMVAYMIARDVKASDNTLADYVLDDITAPTFSQEECYNTNWKGFDESEYVPSSIWKVSSPWAGSVFGSSVGVITEDSHPNHDIIEQGENSVELIASNNKGKIASNQDGLVMYFQEIGANQDFTLTATAHINSYDSTVNQTGFGLMLRDNMFADYQYNTKAPYYAVGNTAQNSGKNKVSAFRRLTDGTLEQTVKVTNDPATSEFPDGTEVDLMISRTNGVVTVQYGTDEAVTFTDDLCDIATVSADYDYVGLFVSRAADVTFNNINLTLS